MGKIRERGVTGAERERLDGRIIARTHFWSIKCLLITFPQFHHLRPSSRPIITNNITAHAAAQQISQLLHLRLITADPHQQSFILTNTTRAENQCRGLTHEGCGVEWLGGPCWTGWGIFNDDGGQVFSFMLKNNDHNGHKLVGTTA